MIAHMPDINNKKFKKDLNELVRQIPILEGGMFAEHFSEDFIEASQIVFNALERAYSHERKIYDENFKN